MQPVTDTPAIQADALGKRYGEQWALRDFDLEVRAGSVLGLLGHNGAGKTTAIRILTTLAAAERGQRPRRRVRRGRRTRARSARRIGLTSQTATVDGLMSARANLEMIGRLYHLPRKALARRRAVELLERLSLADDARSSRHATSPAACAGASTWRPASSPRRPCCSSTSRPPASTRRAATSCGSCCASWSARAATLLLTTQYLEEADRLSRRDRAARPRPDRRARHSGRAEGESRRRTHRGRASSDARPARRRRGRARAVRRRCPSTIDRRAAARDRAGAARDAPDRGRARARRRATSRPPTSTAARRRSTTSSSRSPRATGADRRPVAR